MGRGPTRRGGDLNEWGGGNAPKWAKKITSIEGASACKTGLSMSLTRLGTLKFYPPELLPIERMLVRAARPKTESARGKKPMTARPSLDRHQAKKKFKGKLVGRSLRRENSKGKKKGTVVGRTTTYPQSRNQTHHSAK